MFAHFPFPCLVSTIFIRAQRGCPPHPTPLRQNPLCTITPLGTFCGKIHFPPSGFIATSSNFWDLVHLSDSAAKRYVTVLFCCVHHAGRRAETHKNTVIIDGREVLFSDANKLQNLYGKHPISENKCWVILNNLVSNLALSFLDFVLSSHQTPEACLCLHGIASKHGGFEHLWVLVVRIRDPPSHNFMVPNTSVDAPTRH